MIQRNIVLIQRFPANRVLAWPKLNRGQENPLKSRKTKQWKLWFMLKQSSGQISCLPCEGDIGFLYWFPTSAMAIQCIHLILLYRETTVQHLSHAEWKILLCWPISYDIGSKLSTWVISGISANISDDIAWKQVKQDRAAALSRKQGTRIKWLLKGVIIIPATSKE